MCGGGWKRMSVLKLRQYVRLCVYLWLWWYGLLRVGYGLAGQSWQHGLHTETISARATAAAAAAGNKGLGTTWAG